MSRASWMPFVPADYLRDTLHLSLDEHGAYMLLLQHCWVSGFLPNDDLKLSRLLHIPPSRWARIGPTVRLFFQADGPILRHKRIERDVARLKSVQAKRVNGGKARAAQKAAHAKLVLETSPELSNVFNGGTPACATGNSNCNVESRMESGASQVVLETSPEKPNDFNGGGPACAPRARDAYARDSFHVKEERKEVRKEETSSVATLLMIRLVGDSASANRNEAAGEPFTQRQPAAPVEPPQPIQPEPQVAPVEPIAAVPPQGSPLMAFRLEPPPLAPGKRQKPPTAILAARWKDEPDFVRFYKAYPRRVNPEAAYRAWAKVLNSGISAETIIAAVASNPPMADKPCYIPHPATWLNAGGYDNEPLAPQSGDSAHGHRSDHPARSSRRAILDDGESRRRGILAAMGLGADEAGEIAGEASPAGD